MRALSWCYAWVVWQAILDSSNCWPSNHSEIVVTTLDKSFNGRVTDAQPILITQVSRLTILSRIDGDRFGVFIDKTTMDMPLVRALSSSTGLEVWLFSSEFDDFDAACLALDQGLNISCSDFALETYGQPLNFALPGAEFHFLHMYVPSSILASKGLSLLGSTASKSQSAFRGPGFLLDSFHLSMNIDIVANGTILGTTSVENHCEEHLLADASRGDCFRHNLSVVPLSWKHVKIVPQDHNDSNGSTEPLSIIREVGGNGFHRSITSVARIRKDLLDGGSAACDGHETSINVGLLELVPSGLYFDLDETRNLADHGGPSVRGVEYSIDVERPQYRSDGTVVSVTVPLGQETVSRTGTVKLTSDEYVSLSTSVPFHLRYHLPVTNSSKSAATGDKFKANFRQVSLPEPMLFWSCASKDPSQIGWRWVPSLRLSPGQHLHTTTVFSNAVPVGVQADFEIVLCGTLSTVAICALCVLWVALRVESPQAFLRKHDKKQ